MLGKHRVLHKVGNKFHGSRHIPLWKQRVDERLLLRRIGVELAADKLHAVEYVPSAASRRAFEYGMLHKVRKPPVDALVAASGIDSHTAVCHVSMPLTVDGTHAVGKRVDYAVLVHIRQII